MSTSIDVAMNPIEALKQPDKSSGSDQRYYLRKQNAGLSVADGVSKPDEDTKSIPKNVSEKDVPCKFGSDGYCNHTPDVYESPASPKYVTPPKALIAFKVNGFLRAAQEFHRGNEFRDNNERSVLLTYYEAISNFEARSLETVESAYLNLKKLADQNSPHPFVYLGLAKCQLALKKLRSEIKASISTCLKMPLKKVRNSPILSELFPEVGCELTLKNLARKLEQEVKNPKPPDGVCNNEKCLVIQRNHLLPPRREIYRTDIDFTGFTIFYCDAGCKVDYHSNCYAHQGTITFEKFSSDLRKFMKCLKSGCKASINRMVIIGSKGNLIMDNAWSNPMPRFGMEMKMIESPEEFEKRVKKEQDKDASLVRLNADLNRVVSDLESAIKSCQSKESGQGFFREHFDLKDLQFGFWDLITQFRFPGVLHFTEESKVRIAYIQWRVSKAESLLQLYGKQKSKPIAKTKVSTDVAQSVASNNVEQEKTKMKSLGEEGNDDKSNIDKEELKKVDKKKTEEKIGEGFEKENEKVNQIKPNTDQIEMIPDLSYKTSWEEEKQNLIEKMTTEKKDMEETNKREKTELEELASKQRKEISEMRELLAKERHERSAEVREIQRHEEKVRQQLHDLQEKEQERKHSENESSAASSLGARKKEFVPKKKKKSAQKLDEDETHLEEENAKLVSELEQVREDCEKRLKAMKTSCAAEMKKLAGHNDTLNRKIESLQQAKNAAKMKLEQEISQLKEKDRTITRFSIDNKALRSEIASKDQAFLQVISRESNKYKRLIEFLYRKTFFAGCPSLGDLLSGYDLVVDGRDPNSFSGLGEVDLQALADHINHKWQLIINGMKQKMAQRNVVSVSGSMSGTAALVSFDPKPKVQNLQPGSASGTAALVTSDPAPRVQNLTAGSTCGASALASSGPNPTLKPGKRSSSFDECPICFEELDQKSNVVTLKRCRHRFHRDCIKKWLTKERMTCPICRVSLAPDRK